jgi:hypothetical protein
LVFHSYVLGSHLNLHNTTEVQSELLRVYFDFHEIDKWEQVAILGLLGEYSRKDLKLIFKYYFPKVKLAKGKFPLVVPEGIEFLPNAVMEIAKMTNVNSSVGVEVVSATPVVESAPVVKSVPTKKSNVNIAGLTLENYKEKTGHRFRMTKDQKIRGLTREEAFAEASGANAPRGE